MPLDSARSAERRLTCYLMYKNLIEFSLPGALPKDEMSLRAEMFAIRRSVMSLPDSKEKFFLYNKYIRGESMEACAEILGISRRSVFRLKQKALDLYVLFAPDSAPVHVLS